MSARYFVRPHEAGNAWAVCYAAHCGDVIEAEAGTEYAAQRLADALNQRARIRAAAQRFQREMQRTAAVLGGGARRGVRYFEPDAQA